MKTDEVLTTQSKHRYVNRFKTINNFKTGVGIGTYITLGFIYLRWIGSVHWNLFWIFFPIIFGSFVGIILDLIVECQMGITQKTKVRLLLCIGCIILMLCISGCGFRDVNIESGRRNPYVEVKTNYSFINEMIAEKGIETGAEVEILMLLEDVKTNISNEISIISNELEPESKSEPEIVKIIKDPLKEIESTWTYLDDVYATYIAKTIYNEYNGDSDTERAAVVWCILNRVDSKIYPNDIISVVIAPYQFQGYKEDNPVVEEYFAMAKDVMIRWYAEKRGAQDIGRILPKTYLFFVGDEKKQHNLYTEVFLGTDYWDWSLASPYED